MSINVTNNNGVEVIHLALEIDLDTSPSICEQIKKSLDNSKTVHVDLGKVGYIDSSGIATLIEGMQIAKKSLKEFALINVSNEVMKVIKLAHLDKIFKILSESKQSASA